MKHAVRAAVAVFACAMAATLTAQPLRERPSPGTWPEGIYRWSYNATAHPSWLGSEEAKALVLEAAAKWQVCGVRMEYRGETERAAGAIDGENVVGWRTKLPNNLRGVTLGRSGGGRLVERDIAFSAEREEFRRHPELLKKVLVHEFGHAIGLTHSSRCDDVMTLAADCPRADPSTLPLVPTARDIERCRALYRPRDVGGRAS